MKCIKCNNEFEPTKNNINKKHYVCNECRKIYDKEWRKKRRKLGFNPGGTKDPVWMKNYLEEYNKRPEVKKRIEKYKEDYKNDPYNKLKLIARWMVRGEIRKGKIIRKSCEKCGNEKSEAHHPNYNEPLNIIWLCRKHHNDEHKNLRKGL